MSSELTKADVQKARQAIADLSDLDIRIKKAEACGIECEEIKERCHHAMKFLTAFLEVYGPEFPNRRT